MQRLAPLLALLSLAAGVPARTADADLHAPIAAAIGANLSFRWVLLQYDVIDGKAD